MSWGISKKATNKEKIKAEMADQLNGLNSIGVLDVETHDETFNIAMDLLNKMYELGKNENKKENL